MNISEKILNRFPDVKELREEFDLVSFQTKAGAKEFRVKIFKDGNDFQATLSDMDSGFEKPVPWRAQNSIDDLLHELRMHLLDFR